MRLRPTMDMILALRRAIQMLNMVGMNEMTHSDVRTIVKGDVALLRQLRRISMDNMNAVSLYEGSQPSGVN